LAGGAVIDKSAYEEIKARILELETQLLEKDKEMESVRLEC